MDATGITASTNGSITSVWGYPPHLTVIIIAENAVRAMYQSDAVAVPDDANGTRRLSVWGDRVL